jgi:hypothetical protein
MRRIASLMIGELNASHLGISAPPAAAGGGGVGHLGLDFDRADYEATGRLTVTGVVTLGPAALAGVKPGEHLWPSMERRLGRASIWTVCFDNKVNRRTILKVVGAARATVGQTRDVAVRPTTAATERGLRYRHGWRSGATTWPGPANGRLGYVHMPDMSARIARAALRRSRRRQHREGRRGHRRPQQQRRIRERLRPSTCCRASRT